MPAAVCGFSAEGFVELLKDCCFLALAVQVSDYMTAVDIGMRHSDGKRDVVSIDGEVAFSNDIPVSD